ncbi:MAG TPA: Rrf2 family transcriptional regulator [Blastocatellia bacterium]|nr:Rrf2 family transcriptional regulator [Blastocatellia bacterium]
MKLSSQEEYGLRCLLQIARHGDGASVTIPEISRAEGITVEYTAKLLRILRRGGFIKSTRGQSGGYRLARPADQIVVGDALAALGGRLFEQGFCDRHTGSEKHCTHSTDCAIRALWRAVQMAVDQVLRQTTLRDLLRQEEGMTVLVHNLIKAGGDRAAAEPTTMTGVYV